MKTYVVKIFFTGSHVLKPGDTPKHIIEVEESEDATYRDVVMKALGTLPGGYPRSYYAICDDFEK